MKRRIYLLVLLLAPGLLMAQVPQAFQYQATLRGDDGNILASRDIGIRFSILRDAPDGTLEYQEVHFTTTSASGLVSLEIGRGEVLFSSFGAIGWLDAPHFLKVDMDAGTGEGFLHMGTLELLSVPYALLADRVVHPEDADADPENEIQTLSRDGLSIVLSQGGGMVRDSIVVYTPGLGIEIRDQVISLAVPDPAQPVPVEFQGQILWVYPQDHKELVPYGKNVQSDALSATDGLTNTDLAQKVSDTGEISAVTVCNNLVGFGFDDWYLPSRYELDAIYKQSYLVKGLNYNGSYWSSTESSKNTAWYQSFNFGIQMEDNKVHLYSCRCVRKDKQD